MIVFVSAGANEAALVKNLLEGSGIEVSVFDGNLATLAIVIGGVKLAVSPHQEKLAREVLMEYRGRTEEDPTRGHNNSPFQFTEPDEEGGAVDDDPYRCIHCRTLLEPETTVCSKCGGTPW